MILQLTKMQQLKYTDTQDATKLNLSGGTMTGAIDMGANKVTTTYTPTDNADLTTKTYVDGILGSATSAADSAAAAATSESNAATSETNASNSAAAAAASYDDFDDRYLGAKASAPTVDNDGDALVTGALYWNSTSDELYVWNGSAWEQGSFTAGSLLANVVEDTTPQLGGDLDLNGNNITGTGNIDGRDVSADGTKLDGIEAGATADQTAGEIKTAYESNANTNAFTDAEQSKLTGIEAGADVTDTANVTAAGALMDSEVTNLAQVKAFDSSDYATAAQGTLADSAVQPNDSPSFGAITVSGLVDGRDIAIDGAKLDGIEAGATADQTASEILNAIKTVDGSGSGLDADLLDGQTGSYYYSPTNAPDPTLTLNGDVSGSATFTNLGNATLTVTVADDSHNHVISNVDGLQTELDGKLSTSGKAADSNLLDGIDSTQFLRSDTSDSMTGSLAVTESISVGGNDTNSAGLISVYGGATGEGGEIRIYPSAAEDTTIENWSIDVATDDLRVFNSTGDLSIVAQANAGTILYYDGASKLSTTATGIDVTGVTLSDAVQEGYTSLSGTTPSIDADTAGSFALSTSGNTTFTFSSVTSGRSVGFVLKITAGGTHTITWPASVDWAGATAPDAPASGETDVLVFYTVDGGTTWYGALAIDAAG